MNHSPTRPVHHARHRADRHSSPARSPRRRTRTVSVAATLLALIASVAVALLTQGTANASEESVFPDTTVPRTLVDPDRKSVELGLRFSVTVPGTVVGVKYYGTKENGGRHTGSLWSSRGQRLATATFPASDGTGWQSVEFDEPVQVVPGRTYVASYLAPTGRYAADEMAMTRGTRRGHLVVPPDAGVYVYGADGGFPRYTWRSSNYYVDVRFVPDASETESPDPSETDEPTQTPTSPTVSASPSTSPTSEPTTSHTPRPTPSDTASPSSSTTPTPSATPTPTTTSTPTPTPTTTPTSGPGNPAQTGCAPAPSKCGYPDATNTGPSGDLKAVPGQVTSGQGWHWDSRGYIAVDGDGAVVSGISTTATIDVTADNVTIKNSRLNVAGETFGIALRHTTNVTIDHVQITAPERDGPRRLMVGIKDIYGDGVGTVVSNSDISNTSTGIQMDAGTIEDNYIHDLGLTGDDHTNGFTSNAGTRQLTIRHNTVFNHRSQTDAISLFQDFGRQANRLIEDNLLAGGGYTLYAGADADNPGGATNIVVRNNRFSRIYYPRSGYWGPATAYANNSGNQWTGNIWDDSGAGVPQP